jgi:hypothetical protein
LQIGFVQSTDRFSLPITTSLNQQLCGKYRFLKNIQPAPLPPTTPVYIQQTIQQGLNYRQSADIVDNESVVPFNLFFDQKMTY